MRCIHESLAKKLNGEIRFPQYPYCAWPCWKFYPSLFFVKSFLTVSQCGKFVKNPITPGFSIDINKGGFDLHFGVEKPAVNCGYQELLMLKVDQYYTYDISVYDDLISKVLFSNSWLKPSSKKVIYLKNM